jgi:hypothetical protein
MVGLSTMDNVRVTNRNLSGTEMTGDISVSDYIQREQPLSSVETAIISLMCMCPRPQSYGQSPESGQYADQSGTADILTPKETEKPFWVVS